MSNAHLQRGDGALARGAWEDARRAFEAALGQERTAEALEGLGAACWWLNDAPCVFEAREDAYRLYHERGDRASAARIALWLYWDYRAFRSDAAVSNGWLRRAERLLEGLAAFDAAMEEYQRARDEHVLPMYEFTCQLATLAPPPQETHQLFAAIHGNQPAMDAFVQMNAGTISPAEFFSPENVARIMAAGEIGAR